MRKRHKGFILKIRHETGRKLNKEEQQDQKFISFTLSTYYRKRANG